MDKRTAQLLMRRLYDTTHHYRDVANRLLNSQPGYDVVVIDHKLYRDIYNALSTVAFPGAPLMGEDGDDDAR